MSEPLSSGAAKVAEEMMKEVESAAKQAEQLDRQQTPDVQFDQMLDTQRVTETQEVRPSLDSANVLRAAVRPQVTVPAVPAVPAIGNSLDTKPLSTGLQRIMADVMQGQNKLEEIINMSLSGRRFSTPELLAMQAGVYRFTQELELTSKVVEKSTATVKQTMNTQV